MQATFDELKAMILKAATTRIAELKTMIEAEHEYVASRPLGRQSLVAAADKMEDGRMGRADLGRLVVAVTEATDLPQLLMALGMAVVEVSLKAYHDQNHTSEFVRAMLYKIRCVTLVN